MRFILHTNYHALINKLISHIVPYIHQIIAYSLVSGSMKRQDIVAYFYVRIVKTRWTHMLHPNSRFLTLLRGQNFPSWRTGFNSLLKPQLFIISKYLGGQIKCQGRDHGHLGYLGYLGYFRSIYPHPFWYCGGSCPCFVSINHYLYKKLSLYIQFPKKYLGLGFEFEPQRIRDLAIVC